MSGGEGGRRVVRAGEKVGQSLRDAVAGRANEATRAVESIRFQFEAEQPVLLERPGQPQRPGLLRREAEAAVVGRVTDEQDRLMAELARLTHRALYQRGADTATACFPINRNGAEQQRRTA